MPRARAARATSVAGAAPARGRGGTAPATTRPDRQPGRSQRATAKAAVSGPLARPRPSMGCRSRGPRYSGIGSATPVRRPTPPRPLEPGPPAPAGRGQLPGRGEQEDETGQVEVAETVPLATRPERRQAPLPAGRPARSGCTAASPAATRASPRATTSQPTGWWGRRLATTAPTVAAPTAASARGGALAQIAVSSGCQTRATADPAAPSRPGRAGPASTAPRPARLPDRGAPCWPSGPRGSSSSGSAHCSTAPLPCRSCASLADPRLATVTDGGTEVPHIREPAAVIPLVIPPGATPHDRAVSAGRRPRPDQRERHPATRPGRLWVDF